MHSFSRGPYTFDVVDTALPDGGGEVVLLLHGFPQDSSTWSNLSPILNSRGFRCVAPNLRGYSPGARPVSRFDYRIEELVADVVALIEATGAERVHVVGHDWGGAVAWVLARVRPDLVSTLTVLSTPHPDALAWAMPRSRQAMRSWYMFFMQLPVIPEAVFEAALRRGYTRKVGLPLEFATAYERRLGEPDAIRGGINWYRGMFLPQSRATRQARTAGATDGSGTKPDHGARRGSVGPVSVPTTYVWGRHDPYLGGTAARRTHTLVDADYRFVELDAGHWLPECHPEEVAEAIIARATGA
ncbi:MAG: alpha/beta fold hydrolase [Dermatophilus congolensis]|nr:alpha/beta fold hydrolase [Dermatophilus congolensis]